MFAHETQVRVRYCETDQMGYLYHGNYAQYYEIGRVESLRSLDTSYKEMEEKYNVLMPVMSMSARFVRPAHYDELITIKTFVRKMPDRYMIFFTELFNEEQKLLNAATVKICFLNGKDRKSIPAPPELIIPLQPFFENDQIK